jgi:PAS domain S-box-containing protein
VKRTTSTNSPIKKNRTTSTPDTVLQLAFYNAAQANIISIVSTGEIVIANSAACKLLGYSKKELITKNRKNIFNIKEASFKKMLRQRTAEGHSVAIVTAIKKNGKLVSCEITSSIFTDEDGIEKSITSIIDIRKKILEQKTIDTEKERIVAKNIVVAVGKSDARVIENNKWIKHISKTSYDVMWDWDLVTNMVYIGESIKEVLGYTLKNNLVHFSDLEKYFIIEENGRSDKHLKSVLASGCKSWSDSYKVKRKDGSIASVNSRAAIVRDINGKAIRMIGATQDVSLNQELENKLEQFATDKTENTNLFLLASQLSYDGIWDWDIPSNKFFLGDGFEKIVGYTFTRSAKEDLNWHNFLHPGDKKPVAKALRNALASRSSNWEQAFRFIRADGSAATVFCKANIIRDADGKACRMIGAMHDLSLQKELEEKLEHEIASSGQLLSAYHESFRLMFNSSSDILYDIDIATDEIVLSDGYQTALGYPITPHMKTGDVWLSHLHPDDRDDVFKDYHRMLVSTETEWKYSYRFLRADGSIANLLSSRIILRNADGVAYRMIGSMQDISKQKVLEEKLAHEIKLKEQQIADAMLEAKEAERSDLGKELHDNVNQLLTVSRLYLKMAKQGGENSEMYLSRSSDYTMNAIEEIRKLTKGLVTDSIKFLGLADAVKELAADTMQVNTVKITCQLDASFEDEMTDKFKLNVYRIIQEHLNNILKHAFAKNVTIAFSKKKNSIILVISDNGVGFDIGIKSKGIGIDNIKSRAKTSGGKADFVSQPGNGCVLTVTFV